MLCYFAITAILAKKIKNHNKNWFGNIHWETVAVILYKKSNHPTLRVYSLTIIDHNPYNFITNIYQ